MKITQTKWITGACFWRFSLKTGWSCTQLGSTGIPLSHRQNRFLYKVREESVVVWKEKNYFGGRKVYIFERRGGAVISTLPHSICSILYILITFRDRPKFIRYPGRDYRQGGADFFWEKKGGLRFFLGEKKGGVDFFWKKKKGARTFFGRKKGGRTVFLTVTSKS